MLLCYGNSCIGRVAICMAELYLQWWKLCRWGGGSGRRARRFRSGSEEVPEGGLVGGDEMGSVLYFCSRDNFAQVLICSLVLLAGPPTVVNIVYEKGSNLHGGTDHIPGSDADHFPRVVCKTLLLSVDSYLACRRKR